MKVRPPLHKVDLRPRGIVAGAVPKSQQTDEERAMLEQAAVEDWIAALEAGEQPQEAPEVIGEWSTVQEVARRHKCAPKTIRARIADGSLKAVQHGPKGAGAKQLRYRIHRDDEAAWVAAKGEQKRSVAARKAAATDTFKAMIGT